HRIGEREPLDLAALSAPLKRSLCPTLGPALGHAACGDDLDDRCAHVQSPRQMLAEECQYLAPAVERLLHPVHGPVVIEDAVAGAVVAVELVALAVLLELGFVLVDLLGARRAILVAKDAEQRAGERLGELDG